MVILLGGAFRAGKGIVARALARRRGIALMSLDILKMGLHRAVPSLDVDPRRGLSDIRKHSVHANDWLNEHSDEEILDVVRSGIEFSAYLSAECHRLGLAYLDGSDDFQGAVHAAVEALMA